MISVSAARSSNCRRLRCRLVISETRSNSGHGLAALAWLLLTLQRIIALFGNDFLPFRDLTPNPEIP